MSCAVFLPGLGEPVFDKLEADLAKAMLSLPATKGFEIGSGFAGSQVTGAEHNDIFEMRDGKVRYPDQFLRRDPGRDQQRGEHLFPGGFQADCHDSSSAADRHGIRRIHRACARGRHDPCVLPRAVPMVEAMAALVLCDHFLRQRAQSVSDQA